MWVTMSLPPASAKIVDQFFDVPHISTGEILRNEIKLAMRPHNWLVWMQKMRPGMLPQWFCKRSMNRGWPMASPWP